MGGRGREIEREKESEADCEKRTCRQKGKRDRKKEPVDTIQINEE
jgi:hypothetical protein